jgi:uncharacterized Zn finger protein
VARENAADKAHRYLVEGRVAVTSVAPGDVDAIVRGDGQFHTVTYRHGMWNCTCPARGACSHLLAIRSVVVVDIEGRP